jgi:carboxypeptidase PM20D1
MLSSLLNLLLIIPVLLLFLAAFMLFRTLTYARPLEPVEEVELPEVNAESVAQHLAGAIKFQTVSVTDGNPTSYMPFLDLQHYLEGTYPLTHTHLSRKRIHDYALLYTWVGSDPELDPIVLMAHQDVVPVAPETRTEWQHDPFGGEIADGYVWGRGAQDCKMQMIGIMEAVEQLLVKGYKPERTIYLAFGFDEEIGGHQGAKEIAGWLQDQDIHPEAVLDEGGAVAYGILPGIETPVGLIATAEKGFLTLKLTVDSAPGHSSTPPRETAIGILSKALAFLEATPQPAHMDAATMLFRGVAPLLPFAQQFALANLWLFGRTVRKNLEKSPSTNAMIHTTVAPTIFQAGATENVLPAKASAYVNFRLLPGETIAGVCERVRKIIDDKRVAFEPVPGFTSEASPFSSTEAPEYEILSRTIRQVFGGVPVAPLLMLGASDSRHFASFSNGVYRFIPLEFDEDALSRVHGINERVEVEGMGKMVQFFEQLIPAWAGDTEATH